MTFKVTERTQWDFSPNESKNYHPLGFSIDASSIVIRIFFSKRTKKQPISIINLIVYKISMPIIFLKVLWWIKLSYEIYLMQTVSK